MDFWEWFTLIGGIVGGVAFLMAVQPFLEFIWGRPKIQIEFEARDKGSVRYLDILLTNVSVGNPILKFLGVSRRTAADVVLSFRVRDNRTQIWVVGEGGALLSTIRDENKLQISLPSSIFSASCTLIRTANGETLLTQGEGTTFKISPGKYEIELTVHYSEIHVIKKWGFSVGTQPYDLFWESVKS